MPPTTARDQAAELRREAGVWLRSLREQAGLSQRLFADALGLEYYTFISQLEAGRGRVPPERYADWARVLEVDVKEFTATCLKY